MINADEHKQLLEQVTELERNSINYFNVEKEFFLIDSDNLHKIQTRLYGYSIQRDGIYEDDNLTPEAINGLDGRGCYVYVEVKDGKITIKQDLNGSWGIYLFRHGDYFALSNSFFRLVDHVKFKYPLTVNRDYCYHLLTEDFCTYSYSETAIREISCLERNAIIEIDLVKKELDIELINYRETGILPDSEEGLAVLDEWLEFWRDVFGNVAQRTKFIRADLSGGFDSRITLVPLLHSGIDLNSIRVQSYKGFVLTAAEDYKIASQIADHYGFKLNQPLPARRSFNLSLSDIFNLDFYHRQTFHKWPAQVLTKSVEKLYYINGCAGEIIRGNWLRFNRTPKEMIDVLCGKAKPYSKSLADKLSRSIKAVVESTFDNIRSKYNIENKDSKNLVQHLYNETRCRIHFGKMTPIRYFQGTVSLSPALDPGIRTLRIDSPQCPDAKLLITLIFTRYEPDLLTFPFDSGRFIAPETIEYARKISESFPRKNVAEATGGGAIQSVAA